eukprot:133513_1
MPSFTLRLLFIVSVCILQTNASEIQLLVLRNGHHSLQSVTQSVRKFNQARARRRRRWSNSSHQNDPIEIHNLTSVYDAVFQRVNFICGYCHLQRKQNDWQGSDCTSKNLIVLIRSVCDLQNTSSCYFTAWNQFSLVYFRYFADKYKLYFDLITEMDPILTTDTFHAIFDGLSNSTQHLKMKTLNAIVANVIIIMTKKEHRLVLDDASFYVQQIMQLFAKTSNFYGGTTIMIYLEEQSVLDNESVSRVLDDLYKQSFWKANIYDLRTTINRLVYSPRTLSVVTGVILPMYGVDKRRFAEELMSIYALHRNFNSAVELLLDCDAKVSTMDDTLWVRYLEMVQSVSNVTEFNRILCGFQELNYDVHKETNNKMDHVIFFTFYYIAEYHYATSDMLDETYDILDALCDRSYAFNDGFLRQLFQYNWRDSGRLIFNILQRRRQVRLGKATDGYRNYIAAVKIKDRDPLDPSHPVTPNAKAMQPNRHWCNINNSWRRALHQWDRFNNSL